MRDPMDIPKYCGECAFFARNTCYFGHNFKVNKFTPSCASIRTLQGGYSNEELWNEECRTLRERGMYDRRTYLGL